MTLDQDSEAVYRALEERSPQDAADLAASSGVHGERLERAMEFLENAGLAVRGYETDGGGTGYSFSWGQLP